MGTTSQVTFLNATGQRVASVYETTDGHPSSPHGVGWHLAKFLDGMHIANHSPMGSRLGEVANTACCLAAQWVALRKDRVGRTFLIGPDQIWDAEFEYIVRDPISYESRLQPTVTVLIHDKHVLTKKPASVFKQWCEEWTAQNGL